MKSFADNDTDKYLARFQNQLDYENDTFGITTDRHMFWSWQANLGKDVLKAFKLLDDDIVQMPLFLYFNTRALVSESFSNFILLCHQHGICDYFQSLVFLAEPNKDEPEKPQILTMQKLSAGFLVWFGSVFVACLVFVCEIIWFIFKQIETGTVSENKLILNPRTLPNYSKKKNVK